MKANLLIEQIANLIEANVALREGHEALGNLNMYVDSFVNQTTAVCTFTIHGCELTVTASEIDV